MTPSGSGLRDRLTVLLLADADDELAGQLAAVDLDLVVWPSIEIASRRIAASSPDAVLYVDRGNALADVATLRAARGGEQPAILVVTAETPDVTPLLAAGADDVCGLPVPPELLQHRLVSLVRMRRERRVQEGLVADLGRAQRIAGIVQWHFDPEARTFRWTHEANAQLAGLEGEGTLEEALLRRVHPDDRARVASSFAAASAQQSELRLVLPDGKERLFVQEATVELDRVTGRSCLVGVAHDVTELREAERQVDRLAFYDELTSLPNRAHASRFLKAALGSARRRKQGVAVLLLGLDRFRQVNDRFGHAVGDAVLQEVASRLLRARDERVDAGRAGPFVARLGGDELVVVLGDVGTQEDPRVLFDAFSRSLCAPYRVGGSEVVLTVSAGTAAYPSDGASVEQLLRHAESALHAAKESGRNALVVFDAALKKRLDRKHDVENRLRLALASGTSLELHYQPKVELPSGHVRSVEALLRWTAEGAGGPISPFELVGVAEETGLIHPLGDWILRTACKQAKRWADLGAAPVRIAVNISARQFGATDFLEKLERVLHETALPAALLELEITEGVMMADAEAASHVLERVKQLGIRISLDDFGTGFSSLAYLTRFPIDTLKIDRSFVVGIGVTKKSETIISAIMALSRSLDIEVVAEGVETDEQRRFLEQQGPVEIQGWLFSKALPADAAARWIEDRRKALASSALSVAPRHLRAS